LSLLIIVLHGINPGVGEGKSSTFTLRFLFIIMVLIFKAMAQSWFGLLSRGQDFNEVSLIKSIAFIEFHKVHGSYYINFLLWGV
jgi:hypothetical protein